MGVIVTSDARCKDCYKCVRHCPIKAIKVVDGKAQVWDELCVHDGACINVCPQSAKRAEPHLPRVETFLRGGLPVVASIAPSFVARWPGQFDRLADALRDLGFYDVQETAVTAERVARAHVDEMHSRLEAGGPFPVVTSSCPAVVSMVETHFPEWIGLLADVVSPMVAHGRMIKRQHGGNARVVFIGPCVAKKYEMELDTHQGAVDAALTFDELAELLESRDIELDGEGDAPARSSLAQPTARLFPLEGGLLQTADIDVSMMNMLKGSFQVVSGVRECLDFLQGVAHGRGQAELAELMACPDGCIGGPYIDASSHALHSRRDRVWKWYGEGDGNQAPPAEGDPRDMKRRYRARPGLLVEPSESELAKVLSKMGKEDPEDHLNCGACGYDSCRQKAVAVFRGAAEVEMCIPYMRKRAESMASVLMHEMPSGVIVADRDLRIVSINPAIERMFHCRSDQMKGRKLGYLIDPRHFRRVLQTGEMSIVEGEYPSYNRKTKEYIFYVADQDVVIGILVDTSQEEKHKRELVTLRKESLLRAREVIDKQMRVAQEIAGLMGETTAETKTLLTSLMQVIENDPHAE